MVTSYQGSENDFKNVLDNLWNLLESRYVMVTMTLPWAYPKTLMEV